MAKLKKVHCKNCNKAFYRSTRRFNEAVKFSWNHYCSKGCESKFKTKKQILHCENCDKKIMRTPRQISPHNYCCSRCAIIVNNQKYPRKRLIPILKTCIVCKKEYKKSSGNKKYCSLICRAEKERYKPEELLDIIKKSFKKLKRVPARREILKGVNEACRKYFGSWNNAVLVAGFIPNRSHDNRMYKRVISKANDGHLCDSVSELLIDNWLHKNNIAHERDTHYPKTNHRADWKILPYRNKEVFVEYFGLANDSPRYDRSIKEKEAICKSQNILLLAIYPKDLYPKINLENNLRNKFKEYLPA